MLDVVYIYDDGHYYCYVHLFWYKHVLYSLPVYTQKVLSV